jgi:hypothetical protein
VPDAARPSVRTRAKLRYHDGVPAWSLTLDGRVGRAAIRDTRFLLHVAGSHPQTIQGTLLADVVEVLIGPGEREFIVTHVREWWGWRNQLMYEGKPEPTR